MSKLEKFENTKDELVGKAMEAAGKLTSDQELEFTGKFKQMTTEIKGKTKEMRENVLGKANDYIDQVRSDNESK